MSRILLGALTALSMLLAACGGSSSGSTAGTPAGGTPDGAVAGVDTPATVSVVTATNR